MNARGEHMIGKELCSACQAPFPCEPRFTNSDTNPSVAYELGKHDEKLSRAAKPIDEAIRDALIERGWKIDPDAKQNASGELREFIDPQTGTRMAWLDAVLTHRYEDKE
jgi:hypothetical protein